jgi:antitoxin (DNA-binding transcriptional repressor) of toxin-antitoxin stability system
MEASIVDLRYRMKEVLRALERRESVTILYHGKVKGRLIPAGARRRMAATAHPFFGMTAGDTRPVAALLTELRGGRFRAL